MIVTICGSMKFAKEMIEEYNRLSMKGELVFLPVFHGAYGYSRTVYSRESEDDPVGAFEEAALFIPNSLPISDEDKSTLMKLHFKKIEESDYIYVVNPFGYIGESTKAEIAHAKKHLTPVYYMVPLE